MKEKLLKKYGPLPLWAWGIIALVGIYFGYAYLRKPASGMAANAGGVINPDNLKRPTGGGGGSLTLPMDQVVGGTDTPPFTSPAPIQESAPQAPLGSAPITVLDPPPIIDPELISSYPEPSYPEPNFTRSPDYPTYIIPAATVGETQTYFTPQNWFQNEQGFQKVLPAPISDDTGRVSPPRNAVGVQ